MTWHGGKILACQTPTFVPIKRLCSECFQLFQQAYIQMNKQESTKDGPQSHIKCNSQLQTYILCEEWIGCGCTVPGLDGFPHRKMRKAAESPGRDAFNNSSCYYCCLVVLCNFGQWTLSLQQHTHAGWSSNKIKSMELRYFCSKMCCPLLKRWSVL